MTLKDFIDLLRHTKLSGRAIGQLVDSIEFGVYKSYHERFEIEAFNGTKIEKHKFKRI